MKRLAETCVQRRTRPVSRSGVTRWNSCFLTTATVASRCRSRKRLYFSWNLSRNGNSQKFHETDHVTRCNACGNLFRSAVAHKFQLKVSTCNGGLSFMFAFPVSIPHGTLLLDKTILSPLPLLPVLTTFIVLSFKCHIHARLFEGRLEKAIEKSLISKYLGTH